jgi:hypothetical protein
VNLVTDRIFRLKRCLVGPLKARRTQVYCVGTAKSGTHSICSMFSRNVAARHEPQISQLAEYYLNWRERRINDRELTQWIRARDRELALEVDSSWFNILILKFLAQEFPEARFVLTIRDCYSWVNSEFKRVLHNPSQDSQRTKIREHLYGGKDAGYATEEQLLKETGLFPLDSYLRRWAAHNQEVLATIAGPRLLVVRTDQIQQRAYEIADFAGLPRYTVRLNRTHEYRNPVQHDMIRELDRNFLEAKVEQHCRPLMKRFFPEIQTFNDVKL